MINDIFWDAIIALVVFLTVCAFLEFRAFLKAPPGHPERGLYVFNILFLFCVTGGVLWGGRYLEERRIILQAMIPEYPYADYRPERGGLLDRDVWVYSTSDATSSIVEFYRDVASGPSETFYIDGAGSNTRMFIERSGKEIFLTIKDENGKRMLYYSRNGSARTVQVGE